MTLRRFLNNVYKFIFIYTCLCAIVAGDLAEGFVTVNDGEVDDLGVGQEEAAVGCNTKDDQIQKPKSLQMHTQGGQ